MRAMIAAETILMIMVLPIPMTRLPSTIFCLPWDTKTTMQRSGMMPMDALSSLLSTNLAFIASLFNNVAVLVSPYSPSIDENQPVSSHTNISNNHIHSHRSGRLSVDELGMQSDREQLL
jgi:hypothetical protein